MDRQRLVLASTVIVEGRVAFGDGRPRLRSSVSPASVAQVTAFHPLLDPVTLMGVSVT